MKISNPGIPTKEFYVWLNETESTEIITNGARCNAAAEVAKFEKFLIPHDFISIQSIVAIVQPAATSTQRFDIHAFYSQVGEAYNTHNETDNDFDTVMVASEIVEIDVTGALSALSAGDIVALTLTADAVNTPNCIVQGLRVRYN